jgi:hypothetical protein
MRQHHSRSRFLNRLKIPPGQGTRSKKSLKKINVRLAPFDGMT